jgi:hypothetical protein
MNWAFVLVRALRAFVDVINDGSDEDDITTQDWWSMQNLMGQKENF